MARLLNIIIFLFITLIKRINKKAVNKISKGITILTG